MTTLLLEEASGPMSGRMPKDCMIRCETAEARKTFKERIASQVAKPRKDKGVSLDVRAIASAHTHILARLLGRGAGSHTPGRWPAERDCGTGVRLLEACCSRLQVCSWPRQLQFGN